jgi:transposase InsO family protein
VSITLSMGRTGSALDNAMAENFVSTLRDDLVSGLEFPSRQAAKTAMFDYLETFYNTRQLHSALGNRSPADFEEDRMEEPRACYEPGRKSHRNADSTVGLVPSRPLFPAFLSRF